MLDSMKTRLPVFPYAVLCGAYTVTSAFGAHSIEISSEPAPLTPGYLLAQSSGGGFFKNLFEKPAKTESPSTPGDAALQALSSDQVAGALKQALGNGIQHAVADLGRTNGFLNNLDVRIPMPKRLQRIEKGLRKIGQDKIADDFITTMNQAAEQAVPAAATIFSGAVQQMSIADAKSILQGADDAATQYFRKSTEKLLVAQFRPIVEKATAKAGATAAYKTLMNSVGVGRKFLNFGGNINLDKYVTDEALNGLFKMIAAEEIKIRQNPAARTTQLLQSVFDSLNK